MNIMKLLTNTHSLIKRSALMLAVLGLIPFAAQAATVTKAATGTDLTDGASWGGTAPGSGDVATWVSTSLGAGLTLGSPSSWGGIGVASALSAIGITGAGPLTLGAGGIDMSVSTVNMTLGMPIELGISQTWMVNSGRTLTASGIISGTSMGLTKAGVGTLTLNGSVANTFTGGLTLNGGTLAVDFSSFGAPTNLINSANTLTFNGGVLTIKGHATATPTSQTLGNVMVNVGGGSILGTAGAATKTNLVNLGTITATASGSSLLLGAATATGVNSFTTASDKDGQGIYGGRVVWFNGTANTGYDWTTTTSGSSPYTLSSLPSGSYMALPAAGGASTVNYKMAAVTLVGGSFSVNTLKLEAPSGDLALGTSALTISGGGLLVTGTTAANITGVANPGLLAGNGSGAYDLIVHQFNSGGLTISAGIGDNAGNATTLTKAGSQPLTLSGLNTFSGGVSLNAGTLKLASFTALGASAGTFTIAGGTTLDSSVANLLIVNNNAVTMNGDFTFTGSQNLNLGTGNISLGSTAGARAITVSANTLTLGGAIANGTATALTKLGAGTLVLAGSNTYSGGTTHSAGVLTFSNTNALPASGTVTVAASIPLGLGVGGTSTFTSAHVDSLFANTLANVTMNAASLVGLDTTAGSFTYTSSVPSTTLGLTKLGANTLTLTGANAYAGQTTVSVGVLNIQNATALGTTAAGTTVSTGASLQLQGGITVGAEALSLNGTGLSTDGALRNISGANVWQGTVTLAGTTRINADTGSSLTFNTAANSITGANIALSLGGSGSGTVGGTITTGTGALTKDGFSIWTLSGANTYSGQTTLSGGILLLNHATALPGGIGASGGTSALQFNNGVLGLGNGNFNRSLAAGVTGATFNNNGGWAAYGADRVVNLGGAGATITWATATTGFNAKTLILSAPTATHTVELQNPLDMGNAARTVQVDDGAAAVDGKLSGSITGIAGGNLSKSGIGTLALTGANNYVGTTAVSAGTLLVNGNNSGSGAVSVSAGAALGGTGIVASAVSVAAGGAINLRDGAIGTLTLGSTLALNGSATSPILLSFDLGSGTATTDKILVTGAVTASTANGVIIYLNQLAGSGTVTPGTYTLIQSSATSTYTGCTLATTNAGGNAYALNISGNTLQLIVGAGNAGPDTPFTYWNGNTAVWNTAQWYADSAFTSPTNSPGYSSNVRFAPGAINLATTLGQNYEINSLTVESGLAATSISGNALTIDAAAANGNTAGNGITVNNTAGTTIASKVGLASSQTWTVGTGATLTNSGVVFDLAGGCALTKAGDGMLALVGVNTFNGAITVSGGTFAIGGAGQLNSGSYGANIVNNGIFNYASSANQTLVGVMSGTGSLIKSIGGASTLTLNSESTYSGGTTINAGSIGFGPAFQVNPLGSGTTTVNSGGTLALNATALTTPLILNGGTVTAGNSFGSAINGPMTLNATSTISISGGFAINGNISGVGGLTKTLASTVPITGINTYTGPTTISAGALKFKSSLYGNDTDQWTPANITVASNAVLVLNVGGPGEFTIAQFGTLFNQLTTGVNNNGLKAGSQIGLDTSSAGAAAVHTITANLADATGIGGGATGIKHFGVGTLELAGSNTYSGVTITDGNGTLKVSSLNSVNGGNPPLASSSLGRPTTIPNGTIWLGTQATYQGGNLTYTGTGETTDRVLNMGGGGGETYRLDQSGTGLLKFTSNMTMTDNRGTKYIILQGSTAGTGEMAGVIPNAAGNGTALTKSGTGAWTLSGTNLYTSTTTVSQGTLLITGSISNGAVTVASGATLGGGGTIGSNVTYASGAKALFTPGQTLKIMGSLILNNNVVNVNLPANLSGGTYTLATYNTTGSSGTFATVPVAVNGTLSPQATITTAGGTVKLYVPPKGMIITFH